ncbi:hypothetical protein [Phenylobacterium immobile]|uniref:hypothetical protein n=1 Tax=Phenylobacterium immobile TaxID=21 RepID=UPI000A7E13B3|nr:hypothetical protein [Phenylobacterium immobile]
MTLAERIPGLSDDEIKTFLANAVRLRDSGDAKRAAEAAEMVPVLEEAYNERRAAKNAQTQARRAATRPRRAAATPAAA